MEKEKSKIVKFTIDKDNPSKIFLRNISRKSMTIQMRTSIINEQNKKNNKDNYYLPMTKNISELIRIGKRRGTRKASNIIIRSFKKNLKNQNVMDKEYVFSFLNKNPYSRKDKDIKSVANYLSSNYKYFTNLKNNDSQLKVEKLTKIIKLEIYSPGESIINFGETGDKFYIVLEGFVEVYKPIFESIRLTKNEFIKILNYIKYIEKNEKKYLRIKNYNKERNIDISEYEDISPDMDFMNVKDNFFIEELEKLGKYGEGFSFGEIALIKNCERNATIKSVGGPNENTILLSIDKESYNQAIKKYEEKKLAKDIETFINVYPFLKHFNKDRILQIFNNINRITLEKDEYLFHQNDKDDNLYFIENGIFSLSIDICFPWINEYIDYIVNMKDNIIGYLSIKKQNKFSKVLDLIEKFKDKQVKSPMIFNKYYLWERIEDKKNENNLIGLKIDEEKLNSNNNIYKIHIKNIDYPMLLGIEDTFEFKTKLYTIQCISEKAEIKSIKITDFIKIIFDMRENDLIYLLEVILRRKIMIKNQIIQSIKYLSNKIVNKLENRYEKMLNSDWIIKKERDIKDINKDKSNKIVSLIKIKGYKNSIQDMLDEPVDFLSETNDKIIKKSSKTKNERKLEFEDIISLGVKKNQKNFGPNDKFKNNKNNILILKRILRANKINKNIKRYNRSKLNLSNFYINRSLNNISNIKSLSNRKLYNNNSIINTNSETNIGNNTFYNLFNIDNKLNENNTINNLVNEKKIESQSLSYYKNTPNKFHKQNNKIFKNYMKFHNSKSDKNFFKSPISFNNYITKEIKPFTFRDFIFSSKRILSTKTLNNNINVLKKNKNIKINKNNKKSEILNNNNNINKIENSFLDSKNKVNKNNNSIYGYMDDNNDFYLCNDFSKKFKCIFDSNKKTKNYNFPFNK